MLCLRSHILELIKDIQNDILSDLLLQVPTHQQLCAELNICSHLVWSCIIPEFIRKKTLKTIRVVSIHPQWVSEEFVHLPSLLGPGVLQLWLGAWQRAKQPPRRVTLTTIMLSYKPEAR